MNNIFISEWLKRIVNFYYKYQKLVTTSILVSCLSLRKLIIISIYSLKQSIAGLSSKRRLGLMYHADQTGYYGFVSRFPSLCNARTTSTEWIRGRGTLRILNLSLHGLRYVIEKNERLTVVPNARADEKCHGRCAECGCGIGTGTSDDGDRGKHPNEVSAVGYRSGVENAAHGGDSAHPARSLLFC